MQVRAIATPSNATLALNAPVRGERIVTGFNQGAAMPSACSRSMHFSAMSGRATGFSKRVLTAMGLLSIILGLLGCDTRKIEGLEEGVSTEADVRARFGEPEKVWSGEDLATLPLPAALFAVVTAPGSQTFEYNRQPSGNVNYMITIGPDGRMSALRQVLSPQNFSRVLPGMTMEQVRKMLGKPMKITPFALQQSIHYDWRYLSPPNTPRVFTVVFDRELRVVSTASADEESISPGDGTR